MKLTAAAATIAIIGIVSTAQAMALDVEDNDSSFGVVMVEESDEGQHRQLGNRNNWVRKFNVRIDNLSFQQPLGGVFVMTHNNRVNPLYQMGEEASEELADLAETGNPAALVEKFDGKHGVASASSVDGPLRPGASREFKVTLSRNYPYLTLGSMAINTNDCFVALNGVRIGRYGSLFNLPGLDAGSEVNNELCTSIPGPGCALGGGNVRSGGGEGFVHIHRGFHGINTGLEHSLKVEDLRPDGQALSAVGYDWRNPMVRVTITPCH